MQGEDVWHSHVDSGQLQVCLLLPTPLLHWLRQSSTTCNFLLVVVLSSVYFQFKFPLLFGSCSCNCVFYSDPESREDSTSVEVLNEAKETLLQGLTDENQGLQWVLHNFFGRPSINGWKRYASILLIHAVFSKAVRAKLLESWEAFTSCHTGETADGAELSLLRPHRGALS